MPVMYLHRIGGKQNFNHYILYTKIQTDSAHAHIHKTQSNFFFFNHP